MATTRTGRGSSGPGADSHHAGSRLGLAIVTGVLLGIGIAGFIDESLFHQLLQWHNFYWATDERGRILSDGLFHVGSTLVLLWGVWRLWRDRASWTRPHARAILRRHPGRRGRLQYLRRRCAARYPAPPPGQRACLRVAHGPQ